MLLGPLLATLLALTCQLVGAQGGGFYGNTAVRELFGKKDFKSHVLGTKGVCVVEFYAPWCGHCRNLKSDYIKAAKSLKGLVDVVAINCDDAANKDLCSQQQIQGFPTIKVYRPAKVDMSKHTGTLDAGKDSGKHVKMNPAAEQYNGPREARAISDFALSRMRNYVHALSNTNHYKSFRERDSKGRPKAVFLQGSTAGSSKMASSRKNGIPPLVKVLAAEFLYQYDIAFVPANKGREIWEALGLDSDDKESSKLVIIKDEEHEKNAQYSGPMTKEKLSEFLKSSSKIGSAKRAPREDL